MRKNLIGRRELLAVTGCGTVGLVLLNGSAPAATAGRFEVTKTEAEWRRQLEPQRYTILRRAVQQNQSDGAAASHSQQLTPSDQILLH